MNLTVYLTSRFGKDPALRTAVETLGDWIGRNGHTLIYGGSNTGLMGVLADSVLAAGGRVIGVETRFFLQDGLQHDGLTELIIAETMAERKSRMIALGDAFLAVPGGVGTLDEISEIVSLTVIGRLQAPCILLNLNGYYDSLRAFFDRMVADGLAEPERLRSVAFADDLPQAIALLEAAQEND